MSANFDGPGSCKQLEKNTKCPKCKKKGVYYVGSEVLHGNPYTPASDTEVSHYYECARKKCKHSWSRLV